MEEDDEFGDLYTDVLRPLATSFQSQSQQPSGSGPPPPAQEKEIPKAAVSSFQKRPIDLNLNSDDDEDDNFLAVPGSNSAPQNETLALAKPGFNFRPPTVGFDLNKDSGQGVGNFQGLTGVESDVQSKALEKKGVDGKLPERSFGGSSFMDEPDIDVMVEDRDDKDDDFVVKDDNPVGKTGKVENFIAGTGNIENFGTTGVESKVEEMGSDPIIPGVSIPGVSGGVDNRSNANVEDDWDSDSEDDLQIVLNDNNHGPMGIDRMGGGGMGGEEDDEDDEDGEPLVIVADNDDPTRQPMMMEEQEWGGEEVGPSGEGDRKDSGDAARVNGVGGVAVAPKIGFNHGFHHPFHSQFKYVRPGAAPMPGAAPTGLGGSPGQVRPPGSMVPGVGRGRGDWRPTGMKGSPAMQKGFHPGYGMPVWGSGASGRGLGSGLEFTLPSHKTIFEVDIDSFEEKPWKLPGVDVTDFFNFGLNEESWKDYCKQLEQLRLETTMQSKIRVYESGRTEQDYDPDLPPELAAAAGIQEIPSDISRIGKTDAGQNDFAKGPARVRAPLPTGRPIQVETGYGERLPSIDTRKPRISDLDVIIEIVCQDSADDESSPENDVAEQQGNDLPSQDLRDGNESERVPQEDTEQNHFPDSYNNQNKESIERRLPFPNPVSDNMNEGDGALPSCSEASQEYCPDSREQTTNPGRDFSGSHEERRSKVKAQGRACERSPNVIDKERKRDKGFNDNEKEESTESVGGKQSPTQLSPLAVGVAAGQEVEPQATISDDEIVQSERDFDVDKEELRLNAATNDDRLRDDNLKHALKKQKLISQVPQALSQEIDDGEDSRTARSSENSKARSGSSKDYRKLRDSVEEEEVHDGRSARMGSVKRSVVGDEDMIRQKREERQENERQRTSVKGREDLHRHKSWDPYSGSHSQAKYESIERRRESENAEGFRQRREEDLHGRRSRVEDTRKREQRDETGSRHRSKIRDIERSEKDDHQLRKQLDNGNWRAGYDKDVASRHRDRDDIPKSRNENIDDLHGKRRKEEAHLRREHAEKEEILQAYRESSSRRKRERDDVYDQRRRDDQARLRDDDQQSVRLREEGLFQRERNDRQREREEWHRIKQSNEEISGKKDKEEARVETRSGRSMEDKVWASQSRGKDEHRSSDKEYHPKDPGRQNELLKRRDRVDNESLAQHRGREDVYARGNQNNSDERRSRYERASTRDDRAANASDNYKVQEKKPKEYPRKGKESEDVDRNSAAVYRKNQEENSRHQISDMGSLKGRVDHGRGENLILVKDHHSRKYNRGEGSSDDEQAETKRGRSKLERWTSHKERDFSIGTNKSSSSMKIKQIDTHSSTGTTVTSKLPDQPSNTIEDKQHPSGNEKDVGGLEINSSDKKPIEDKHLDTVEKLKKRSERFKLPMPGEREASAMKKTENETAQSENRADSEIKAERPARKRRWTSN